MELILGDINGDGEVDLIDATLVLQTMTGIEPSTPVYREYDINGDNRIGLEEVLYILQAASDLR